MKKKPKTHGLGSGQLAQILKVCANTDREKKEIAPDQQKAELLQDLLSETLISGSLKGSPLREELTHICRISGLLASETIRNLLCSPQTDIELIEKTREHGKKLSKSASSTVEHDTANAIYFAAIASALIFHDTKITKFSYQELNNSLEAFSKFDWISPNLLSLFEKASKYCKEKIEGEE